MEHSRRFISAAAAALAALLSAVSCGNQQAIIEEGVPYEMAQERAEALSDVRYNLHFDIPAEKDSVVRGRAEISFTSNADKFKVTGTPLPVIDFKVLDPASIRSVALDGVPVDYDYVAEHIVLRPQEKGSGSHCVSVEFIAPDQSLNRRDDMLYTLLVPDRARTLFPCFDQPNLKARYTLSLCVPEGWVAVTNSPQETAAALSSEAASDTLKFKETEPLSTYLFSFAAGRFNTVTDTRDGRSITMYHRENDPYKVAQSDVIFDEVWSALKWMEDYTGMPYAFSKYDFVVIPGFQFGGMEHTGNTFYTDTRIFLSKGDGLMREYARYNLIAHEVAHLWFGDYVTMKWFDDVWTKEVFANYFAAIMQKERFPESDQSLSFADYAIGAYAVDRTEGANPVKQELGNLQDAGLVYGNIVYDKSPVVMNMISEILSPEEFRASLQEYLRAFPYGNSDWNDLVTIFDRHTSVDMKEFSKVWVDEAGMPEISIAADGTIAQNDPHGRGLVWPQYITSAIVDPATGVQTDTVRIFLDQSASKIDVPNGSIVIPNIDAKSYGWFRLDERTKDYCYSLLSDKARFEAVSPVERASILIDLNEDALRSGAEEASDASKQGGSYRKFGELLLKYLPQETNQHLFSQAISYLSKMQMLYSVENPEGLPEFDETLLGIAREGASEPLQRSALSLYVRGTRGIAAGKTTGSPADAAFDLLATFRKPEAFKPFVLTENELTTMAYELAIRYPEQASEIVALQRSRITNPDRLAGFDYISRAVSSDENALDEVFNSLLEVENRTVEPWVTSALSYLNHPLRADRSRKYILPALSELEEIQRTGDIFFPTSWLSALLSGHQEPEAKQLVSSFLDDSPYLSQMLRLKVLQVRGI